MADANEMVTVFSSQNHDAEQEALAIHSLLEANGLPATMVGASVIPSLEFHVEVPRKHLEEAERVIADARDVGPQGAQEAEEDSEDAV